MNFGTSQDRRTLSAPSMLPSNHHTLAHRNDSGTTQQSSEVPPQFQPLFQHTATTARFNEPPPIEEDGTMSRAPRIWPNPEGIFVRVNASGGPSWVCLRWEKLEEYLLDPRNTEGLPEDDILRRTARHLQAQVQGG